MNFLRTVSSFSGFVVISRITGYCRDWLVSVLLGATVISDALVIAIKIPTFFRRLSAEGAFHNSFLPIFSKTMGKDTTINPETQAFCNNIFTILSASLLFFVVVMEGNFSWITSQLFGTTSPEKFFWIQKLGRVTFPYVLFISVASFFGSVLNAFGRFSLWAASNAIGNTTIILYVLCGMFFSENYGSLFAWGIFFSGCVQCLMMAWAFRRRGFHVSLCRPRLSSSVREFFQKLGPNVLGVCFLQLNILISLYLASTLPPGCLSYLHYADRLNQLPISIVGVSISSVLLPTFLHYFHHKNKDMANKILNRVLRLVAILIFPITAILACCAFPLCFILFGHAKLTVLQVKEVAYTVMTFIIGMPAYIFSKVLVVRFSAEGDMRFPLIASSISIVMDVVLSVALLSTWQHLGIAFAIATSSWINVMGLLVLLYYKYRWCVSGEVLSFMGRLLAICCVVALVLVGSQYVLPPFFTMGFWEQVLWMMVLGITALSLTLLLCLWTKTLSWRYIKFMKYVITQKKHDGA